MDITGTIHSIGLAVAISEKFTKREFIIKENENPDYPQFNTLEVVQDKCSLLDNYKPGDHVKVDFNLRGRLYTNKEGVEKAFNTLQAWKINTVGDSANMQGPPETEDDGLPF